MEKENVSTALLEELIKNRQVAKLRELFETIPTIDLAEAANDIEDIRDIVFIFKVVKSDYTAEFFTDLSSEVQEKVIHLFTDSELVTLLNASYTDDIVDFMEEMPANLVSRILKVVDKKTRNDINRLLNYKENTAGSIMTTEYIELISEYTIKEAIEKIRAIGQDAETIYTIFIIDKKRNFIGTVDLDQFVFSKPEQTLDEIADKAAISVGVNTDQEDVATIFKRYNLTAVPVLNEDQRLTGIITIDDIVDVMEQEATEDMSRMALVTPLEDSYKDTGVLKMAIKTMPWLIVLMILGVFSSVVLSSFQDVLSSLAILSVFIPVLMDTGGNSGGQTIALMIRGIAVGEFGPKDYGHILWKEFRVALLVGIMVSIAAFIIFIIEMYLGIVFYAPEGIVGTALLFERMKISGMVSITLFFTIVISKTLGVTIPMIVKALKKDPAIISAPFITTIVDVSALLIYFFICTQIFQLV
ncbi:MAG: magnesium transporter [Erysipelotrichaceae bacterium]|jgi:magnesium transporter|nr:magnesium transporter [Erysipelotrichaceae bacterium]